MSILFKIIFLTISIVAYNSACLAGFVNVPYSDRVRSIDRIISETISLYEIDPALSDEIKISTMRYVFFGPCKGSVQGTNADEYKLSYLLPGRYDFSTLLHQPRLKDVYSATNAIYTQMLYNSNLGRQPWEFTCRYAAENAFEDIEVGTTLRFCFSDANRSSQFSEKCKTLFD